MAASHIHSKNELLADEYTNGEQIISTETEKAQENSEDFIVTDAIGLKTEIKVNSKSKKGKGRKKKDFDLDL
ncbi:hypothetical protein LOD99_9182 [Oopsacas minuta]|uniref:Uncharacterized protein n=1 Tax=Oopsacas minuta TaxID=111878 RepID=A0AAV7JDE1_9METZ|nr:hypothetical protein LOD99_9182 [Oopsacas minuta]